MLQLEQPCVFVKIHNVLVLPSFFTFDSKMLSQQCIREENAEATTARNAHFYGSLF